MDPDPDRRLVVRPCGNEEPHSGHRHGTGWTWCRGVRDEPYVVFHRHHYDPLIIRFPTVEQRGPDWQPTVPVRGEFDRLERTCEGCGEGVYREKRETFGWVICDRCGDRRGRLR